MKGSSTSTHLASACSGAARACMGCGRKSEAGRMGAARPLHAPRSLHEPAHCQQPAAAPRRSAASAVFGRAMRARWRATGPVGQRGCATECAAPSSARQLLAGQTRPRAHLVVDGLRRRQPVQARRTRRAVGGARRGEGGHGRGRCRRGLRSGDRRGAHGRLRRPGEALGGLHGVRRCCQSRCTAVHARVGRMCQGSAA